MSQPPRPQHPGQPRRPTPSIRNEDMSPEEIALQLLREGQLSPDKIANLTGLHLDAVLDLVRQLRPGNTRV